MNREVNSYDNWGNQTRYQYYGYNEMGTGNGAYPGKLKQITAPNGLKTYYKYDRFGRTTDTITAYGTNAAISSYSRYNWCKSQCRKGAKYVHTTFSQGGVPAHNEVDKLGRTVRQRTLAMDGRELIVDTNYNHLGHIIGVSNPYFAGNTQYWNHVNYDILGRAIRSEEPSGRVDTVSYNGLTRTATIDANGKNQTKTEVRNALNNLLRVTDNANTSTTFRYDSLGRQTKVTGPSNKPITIQYNALGHKTSMNDPDKGRWTYTYNGLGQLITQTDAKGQTTCMAYDTLGRMNKRVDNYQGNKASNVGSNAQANQHCTSPGSSSQTSTWTYYTTGSSTGKLNTVTSPAYAEKHYYDSYGRATRSDTTIKAQTFRVDTTYDSLSRPLLISYPNSSHNRQTRLQVKQKYNALGFNTGTYSPDGSILYNRIEAVDEMGNITNSYYGNGVRSQRYYAKDTGYLEAIYTVGVDLGNVPQDYAVEFDLVGNLQARADAQTGFEESYRYDSMNRLRWAYSNYGYGVKTTEVRYDSKGNITYKSGVGNYSYGSASEQNSTTPSNNRCGSNAGPHALIRISGSKTASYCYDRNGNQTSGDGRAFTYTSFDKPSRITKGNNWINMAYGADRQLIWREQKTVSGSTTHQSETFLLGGIYERIYYSSGPKANTIEERHTVGNAIVIYRHSNVNFYKHHGKVTQQTVYTHSDHLGSIVAITDSNGIVQERLSFDAWGKRRKASTQELLATAKTDPFNFTTNPFALKSSFTSKGFTGHQQLDGVGIIHMGGRIYDAELGRFLQADPFVQDRTNSQALNRYAYVENNPLSYTDPTGYFLKKAFKKIGRAIKKIGSALHKLSKALGWKPLKKVLQKVARVKWLSTAIAVALNFIPGCQGWCMYLVQSAFSAAMTLANGGTIGQVLKGAAIAAVGAGTPGTGGLIGGAVGKIVKNGYAAALITSGILSKAQGGKFLDGVKGAAVAMGMQMAASKIVSWAQGKQGGAAESSNSDGNERGGDNTPNSGGPHELEQLKPGDGRYSYEDAKNQFGTSETIEAIDALGEQWANENPDAPRIGIGDISLEGGGPMPDHNSHQNGVEVDIRPVRMDGVEAPTTWKSPTYSRELTVCLT